MKTSWKAGLSKEQALAIEASFKASGNLRERLTVLLKKKIDANKEKCRSTSTYENPNWAFLQADAIGYERAIEEIISLIE